jgi:hypothetical protein
VTGKWLDRIWNGLVSCIEWLEVRSRWSELRALGQSPLVRASVLMPAFGYILLLNDNVHQYLTIKYDGWLLQYLPSLWRVWLLFYGTFALAIGSIIFSAFCPTEIKRYSSAFQMASLERDHIAGQHLHSSVEEDLKCRIGALSKWEQSIRRPKLGLQTGDQVSRDLIHIWNLDNIKRPLWRVINWMLFWTGFILLAVPATFTFFQVTVLLLKHA